VSSIPVAIARQQRGVLHRRRRRVVVAM